MAEAASEELRASSAAELEKYRAEVEELLNKNEARAQESVEKIAGVSAESELLQLNCFGSRRTRHYFTKCSQQERDLLKFREQCDLHADLGAPNLSMTRTLISRMFSVG